MLVVELVVVLVGAVVVMRVSEVVVVVLLEVVVLLVVVLEVVVVVVVFVSVGEVIGGLDVSVGETGGRKEAELLDGVELVVAEDEPDVGSGVVGSTTPGVEGADADMGRDKKERRNGKDIEKGRNYCGVEREERKTTRWAYDCGRLFLSAARVRWLGPSSSIFVHRHLDLPATPGTLCLHGDHRSAPALLGPWPAPTHSRQRFRDVCTEFEYSRDGDMALMAPTSDWVSDDDGMKESGVGRLQHSERSFWSEPHGLTQFANFIYSFILVINI